MADMVMFENGPYEYEDFPLNSEIYSEEYSRNVIKIFDSGGGGYFYLNLNKNQRNTSDPEGILLLIGEDAEFSPHKPFWAYIDQWTEISRTS